MITITKENSVIFVNQLKSINSALGQEAFASEATTIDSFETHEIFKTKLVPTTLEADVKCSFLFEIEFT